MLTGLLVVARTAHIGASILVAGIFIFELVALNPAGRRIMDDFRQVSWLLFRLAAWTLVAAFLSALFWFWLEIANMSGLDLFRAFSTGAWRTVLFETKFGHIWQFRVGLLAVALVFALPGLIRSGTRQPRRALILGLGFVSVVLLVSLAWISHAAAAGTQPRGLLGDTLHLCAAGGWIGGLVPLVIFLKRADISFSLGKKAGPVVKRFSTLSLCCVGILVVGGVSNSWLLVGSFHALATTRYGWFLLFKLALFVVLIGIGARNRLAIQSELRGAPASPAFLRQLRRNVICEICLALAIVAIVGCLGVTPPARHP
jgi:copper resistance protein D